MNYTPAIYAQSLLEVEREKGLSKPTVRRFVEIVRRNNHTSRLPEIIMRFEDLFYRTRGITRVEITLARRDVEKILPRVRGAFGRKTEVRFSVKPEIIGGVVVTIDRETVIDASVKRQLERMFSKW